LAGTFLHFKALLKFWASRSSFLQEKSCFGWVVEINVG